MLGFSVMLLGDNGAMPTRKLHWDGFYNARDLGGLPLATGGETKYKAYARSADLRFATPEGLDAAYRDGFRTVVDLRNGFETRTVPRSPEEAEANSFRVPPVPEAELPEGMFGVRVPLDDTHHLEFWRRMHEEGRLGSPRYFGPVLQESSGRVVEVLRAIAAAPGGIIYHCAVGRDRTGLVTFALLSLAGVEPGAIAEDYARTPAELVKFYERLEFPDNSHRILENLEKIGHTLESAVLEQAEGFDAWTTLRKAGLTDAELETLAGRLLG